MSGLEAKQLECDSCGVPVADGHGVYVSDFRICADCAEKANSRREKIMNSINLSIPANSAGEMIASTGNYVIRWDGRSRYADIYSAWSWNARVAALADGGVVIHHGELDSVEVVEWNDQVGAPADGDSTLDYVDRVDLLEVLERWIGGRS